MDMTAMSDPLQKLEASKKTPIADLDPQLSEPATRSIHGVVTITWPYNSVKNTAAFILAEPDFRLRRNKGQVRINFSGQAAKAIRGSALGSNDEVTLSLEGVEWETEEAKKRQSLPGASLDWQLRFSDKILLKIKSEETGETRLVTLQDAYPDAPPKEPERDEPPPMESIQVDEPAQPDFATFTPVKNTRVAKLTDGEFESPAFLKRARMSYGSLFEGGFDIFEDDGGARGRGRKRSRFGRDSSAWRYTSQSPSPEPVVSHHSDASSQDEAQPSSPTRPKTADESCQTMELDIPSPVPIPVDTAPANAPETIVPRRDQTPEQAPTTSSVETSDHNAQTVPQNSWTVAPPEATPSFADTGMITDNSSKEPSFQSNPPVSPAANFGNIWDPATVEHTPESFAKAQPTPQFPVETIPSGGISFSTEQTSPFNAPRPENHTDSPSGVDRPDISPAAPIHHEFSEEPPDHEEDHQIEAQPVVHYPSLDVTHEFETESIPHDAQTDYPSSYLDDNQQPSHDVDMGHPPFNQGFHAITNLAPTSWATVNNPPQATAMALTDRLDSVEGSTPDQAVVIDESDSDEDLEPDSAAAEGAVENDRTNTLDVYEDANVKDDVDARYSDEDDELEYDEDDIGDYDIRNYPDDDEDDSHDEDMQQHKLEPEFEDEGSYDEGDEDDEDLEYESEYEMDMEEPQQAPPHVTPSKPTVIDLISSSEDEGEEEDSGHANRPAAPAQPVPDQVSQHRQLVLSNHVPNQSPRYGPPSDIKGGESNHHLGASDAVISSEDEGIASELEEDGISIQSEGDDAEDEEDDDDEEDDEEDEEEDEEEEEEEEGEEGGVQGEELEEEGEDEYEDEDDDEEGESFGDEVSEFSAEEFAETEATRNPMNQLPSPLRQLPEPIFQDNITTISEADNSTQQSTATRNDEDVMQLDEEPDNVTPVPMSAADGLEILSRAVENESSGQGHPQLAKSVDRTVMDTTFPNTKETPMVTVQALVRESSEDAESISGEDNEDERVTAEFQGLTDHETAVPMSSLSHSSQLVTSHATDSLAGNIVRTTSIIIETQEPRGQLPTPRDTQMTDGASFTGFPGKSAEVDVSEDAGPIELDDDEVEAVSISAESSVSSNEHDMVVEIDQGLLVAQPEAVPNPTKHVSLEPGHESEMESVHVPIPPPSPNPIIQVNDDDITQAESFEDISNPIIGIDIQGRNHVEADTPGISLSFQSQMEGDEELQASILENFSQNDEMDEQVGTHMSDDQIQDQASVISEESDFDTAVDEWDTEQPGLDDENTQPVPPFIEETLMEQPTAARSSSPLQQHSLDGHMDVPDDITDASSQIDLSVHLARATNSSKRTTRHREATPNLSRPNTRSSNTQDSSAFDTEDSSVQLARASFTKSTKSEEDTSMTATKLKLVRHLRDELPDCTSLKVLRQHLTKTLDVIGIAMMKPPEPRRGKSGPREYMMSFTITDHSIGPHSVAEVQLYRPHKDTLPQVKPGDVVLLHNFKVISLTKRGFGLRTTDGSSWAVFDHEDQPAQIKGPPVEYGDREKMYVAHLREWFGLLDERARAKLEQANQKIVGASRSK